MASDPPLPRALRVIAALAALALASTACTSVQGDRCNPLQASQECADGLTCVVPDRCAVAACCPATITSRSPAACQPCPLPTDGGSATDVSPATDDTPVASDRPAQPVPLGDP